MCSILPTLRRLSISKICSIDIEPSITYQSNPLVTNSSLKNQANLSVMPNTLSAYLLGGDLSQLGTTNQAPLQLQTKSGIKFQCQNCQKICENMKDYKWHKESKNGRED